MNEQELAEVDIVQRYRESHHRIAQMIAMGCTASFIRQQTGRSQRSITLLLGDPTFQELIAIYSRRTEEKLEVAADTYADLAISNMLRTEQMITDQLDKAEEENTPVALLTLDRIAQGRADRFGYGKHSTKTVTHDFASMLDKAIARSDSAKVIEATAHPQQLPQSGTKPLPLAAPAQGPSEASRLEPPPRSQMKRSFAEVLGAGIKRRRVA